MTSDLRRTLRALRRAPAFTVSAALCIALAVGASTAIYSVVQGILLRPLPYPQEERVLALWEWHRDRGPDERNVVSPANMRDWAQGTTALAAVGGGLEYGLVLEGDGQGTDTELVPGELATSGIFPALGVAPAMGRPLAAADEAEGAEDVAVLSDGLWRRRFGAKPDVLGSLVTIDGRPTRVVGIMPPGFRTLNDAAELWLPLSLPPGELRGKTGRFLRVVARLAPGATGAQARRELATVATRLQQQYPDYNGGWGVNVVPIREQVVGAVRTPLLVLAGAVGLVLLIACANVANLMLVRMTARQQEIAVSSALGAGRGRVVRQLLTESLAIAAIGGAIGTLAAWGAVRALTGTARDIPRLHEVGVDPVVLLFSLAVTVLTGVVFGLVPAVGANRLDLASTLRQGGRGHVGGRARARVVLTGAQIALSLVLLVGAGLLLKSFARLVGEDPGFAAERVLTLQLTPPRSRYVGDTARFPLLERLRERLAAIPGVQHVGYVNRLPISGGESSTSVIPEGTPAGTPESALPSASVRMATPGYFAAMNIPLRRGRLYAGTEPRGAAEVPVVVSERAAREYWPGQDPIGKRLDMEWFGMFRGRVVAVVGDVRAKGLDSLPTPTTYWSPSQFRGLNTMTYTLRLVPGAGSVENAVRRAAAEVEPSMPVAEMQAMEVTLAESVARRRLTTTLVTGFGVVALLLAAVGLYGVVAYSVAARTREFGVRVALGARGRDVSRLVLRHGLLVAVASAAVGTAVALAATRLVAASLYGVAPNDAGVFALAGGTLVLVALLASWLPARRAARTDPVTALRAD